MGGRRRLHTVSRARWPRANGRDGRPFRSRLRTSWRALPGKYVFLRMYRPRRDAMIWVVEASRPHGDADAPNQPNRCIIPFPGNRGFLHDRRCGAWRSLHRLCPPADREASPKHRRPPAATPSPARGPPPWTPGLSSPRKRDEREEERAVTRGLPVRRGSSMDSLAFRSVRAIGGEPPVSGARFRRSTRVECENRSYARQPHVGCRGRGTVPGRT